MKVENPTTLPCKKCGRDVEFLSSIAFCLYCNTGQMLMDSSRPGVVVRVEKKRKV